MSTPSIESSTREERLDYVLNEWRCLHNCELCGKCHILKGRSEEILYADYIDGKRSYMDITLEIRSTEIHISIVVPRGRAARKRSW